MSDQDALTALLERLVDLERQIVHYQQEQARVRFEIHQRFRDAKGKQTGAP